MNFPKYWALGKSGDFLAWRWSDNSMAEAQALADEAARKIANLFYTEEGFNKFSAGRGGYYPDRPFREPILNQITNAAGQVTAVVTRNSYGCQVLNTARIMFVDIDLPEPKRTGGFFQRLFGKPDPKPAPDASDSTIARVENWTRGRDGWGWRVYRTRAGLRLLATHDVFDPGAASSDATMEQLGSDPLYRRLCLNQKCYRARLTPKPWRCDLRKPPARWPFVSPKAEDKFNKWDRSYQEASNGAATCEFIKTIGNPDHHPEIQSILRLHDETTRASSKLMLA